MSGSYFLFLPGSVLKVKVKVAQSCLTLCDPMDYTVHEILQARILEWVAYSSGSFWPRNWTGVSCIVGGFFTNWAIREAFRFSLGRLYILGICPFLPGCPFHWYTVICHSLMNLCISVMSVVASLFSFLTLLTWDLSFFGGESPPKFFIFLYFFLLLNFLFWLEYIQLTMCNISGEK